MLEQRIDELKAIIARHDGSNAADSRFERAVDELVSWLYDDIGSIRRASTRALFDLIVIKVLYVGRRSRHADVIDYLGGMLDTFVYARELFPPDETGAPRRLYFSDVVDAERQAELFDGRLQAYRRYADTALFMSGVFAPSTRRRRSAPRTAPRTALRRTPPPGVDAAYYVSTGKAMYRLAADEAGAQHDAQGETLARLARGFELYADALREMSERYIMGIDLGAVADKLLDHYNRWRTSGDQRSLDHARRYAELLRLERERFPGLFPDGA
jgi:hypothetical protein